MNSHDHAHDSHDHGSGGHSHAPKNFGLAFAIGTALNFGFVVVEVVFGIFAHSLALVADAGHNMGDVLGLLLAWGASVLAHRAPTQRHTYGMRSSSILAALFNAIFLLVSVGAIAWEAIRRFGNPTDVAGWTVIWVSAVGIAINTATALMFMSGRKGDLNIRGAFMHTAQAPASLAKRSYPRAAGILSRLSSAVISPPDDDDSDRDVQDRDWGILIIELTWQGEAERRGHRLLINLILTESFFDAGE